MMTTKNMIISLCVAVMASLITAEPGMQNGKMQRIPPHPDRGYVMPYRWVDSVCRREAEQGGWEGGFTACSTRYVRTIQANEAMCEEYSEKIRKWRPIVGKIPYDSALFEYFPEVHCRSFRGTGRKTKEYVDWIMKVDLSHVRNWYKLENMAETIEEVRYLYNARRIYEAMLEHPFPKRDTAPDYKGPYLYELLERDLLEVKLNNHQIYAAYNFFSRWARGTELYDTYLKRVEKHKPIALEHKYYDFIACRKRMPDSTLLAIISDINVSSDHVKKVLYDEKAPRPLITVVRGNIIRRWREAADLETGYSKDTLSDHELARLKREWLKQSQIVTFLRDYIRLNAAPRYLRGTLGDVAEYLGISLPHEIIR